MAEESVFLAPTSLVLISLALLYYASLSYISGSWKLRARGLQLPPGPKRKFITGNLHQLSRVEPPWITFTSWAKLYGPIVYFRVFGSETIILSSGKAALDLLDSRSAIYSDRPVSWMGGELAGRKHSVFLSSSTNPRFKTFRRLLQTGLSPRASKSYCAIQAQECQVLLKGLANSPEDFMAYIQRNAIAVILKVAYGYQVAGNDDPFVRNLEDGFKMYGALSTPGKYWIEFLPILRFVPSWFPGAGFKRWAQYVGERLSWVEREPFERAKKEIIDGQYVESFVSKHLYTEDGQIIDNETQDCLKWTSAALYVGGGETTVSALKTFFLLMAQYPEVQRRAQADIDQVAPNRLPTLDDYGSLPYVRALIKEISRWAPIAPLAIPHRVMEDDFYEGYFIPKGTKIMANIWAMVRDESIYPDSESFDPTRHLGDNPQADPFTFIFGFGRRICPGAHLAEMSLFLNICCILAVFNISKTTDANGMEVEPKVEWTNGITRNLKPFRCRIKCRSDESLLLLEKE